MSFQSNCCDKLSIALLSCSILVVLDYITEVCSILVTYDSDKCYVYAISATNRLIICLSLNLIISWIYGLLCLCIKIYLSTFIITYVLSVLHTGSIDLLICVVIILCFFCLEDYIIPRKWVKCIMVIISLFLLPQRIKQVLILIVILTYQRLIRNDTKLRC